MMNIFIRWIRRYDRSTTKEEYVISLTKDWIAGRTTDGEYLNQLQDLKKWYTGRSKDRSTVEEFLNEPLRM